MAASGTDQTLAALGDPSRRALYDYVHRQDHPVSREEAAGAVRISRKLAAFHLDKLVEAGLLGARYEAPSDRPRGRGRTPKVYEPAGDGLSVTIPPRRYELIAHILAAAVAEHPRDAARAAKREAREHGRRVGAQQAAERPPAAQPSMTADRLDAAARSLAAGRSTAVGRAVAALAELGFEPERGDGRVLLHNCPFHALAAEHRELVCGLNHAFVAGLLEGVADGTDSRLAARLTPGLAACCVTLTDRSDDAR